MTRIGTEVNPDEGIFDLQKRFFIEQDLLCGALGAPVSENAIARNPQHPGDERPILVVALKIRRGRDGRLLDDVLSIVVAGDAHQDERPQPRKRRSPQNGKLIAGACLVAQVPALSTEEPKISMTIAICLAYFEQEKSFC